MKVVYTFYHGAAFAWTVVHKLTAHSQDDAYLLVADGWDWCVGKPRLLSLLLQFVKCGVFKKIYHYDNRLGRDPKIFDTLEKTETNILHEMDKSLLKQGCNIKNFDRIYSHTDGEDTMGIYLALKECHFYWFENSANMLVNRNIEWINATYKNHIGYREALLKYKTLFGGYDKQHFILYPNSTMGGFPSERCSVFDAEKAARSLSDKEKDMILGCFGLRDIRIEPNTAMLFLQSNWLPNEVFMANESIRNKYKHHGLYMYYAIQCMMDYFLPKDTIPVLKTHPTVMIDENTSKQYFGGIFSFPPLFTVLLAKTLLSDYQPKYRLLLGSTANSQLSGGIVDILCPGVWLFSDFYHKYHIACDILYHLGALYKNSGERFGTIGNAGLIMGYNKSYLPIDINSLIKLNYEDLPQSTEVRYLVIQVDSHDIEEHLYENDFIIITDVWQKMTLKRIQELEKKGILTKILINKKPIKRKEDILMPLGEEYIYLFSKSECWENKLQNYQLEKTNKYSGVTVHAEKVGKYCPPSSELYRIGENINLYECYLKFGRDYVDMENNEIHIEDKITERALENMKQISVKFSGRGKNYISFTSLDTPQRYSSNFRIEALNTCKITIGKIFFANANVLVHASNSEVIIEDDVLFDNNVIIRAMNYHSIYDYEGSRLANKKIHIGEHVWLGYGVTVYNGGDIGVGSIIDPGSVVVSEIPNNCIAVGNPARVIQRDIFWQWSGDKRDYYDLPDNMQIVNAYISRTEDNVHN